MKQQFVVVCVSSDTIPQQFNQQLEKILFSFQLRHSPFELIHSLYAHRLSTSFEYTFLELELLQESLKKLSFDFKIDIAVIPKQKFESQKKVAIFDMDSTLITAEVIDEMAIRHGVGDQVKLITARAMNGELNFDQSLSERVALLKGFQRHHMEDIIKHLQFTPGTISLLKQLKSMGIKTAIASGGFEFFARFVQKELQIDEVFANQLDFSGDELTGKIKGSIVNAQRKEEIVTELAKKTHATLDQVIAIGDGANDIPMLLKAGLGIAVHAKEKVQQAAQYRINFGPMTHALSYMNHEAL